MATHQPRDTQAERWTNSLVSAPAWRRRAAGFTQIELVEKLPPAARHQVIQLIDTLVEREAFKQQASS